MQQEKKDQYKNFCELCSKYFYDKSTLNKHKKNHIHKCDDCNKTFKSESSLKEHKQYHEGKLSQKVSKLNLTADNIIQILALQKHLEQLMLIISNRCQRIGY